MKASLNFREDQKPLIRAKVPISILGLPFLSGISAGETKELRLDLITAFESGPSLRASYRPNDPSNPFTVAIKTGIGPLGAAAGAPMSMTAEFNVLNVFNGGASNPGFSVLFKPRFGDFCLKKSVVSPAVPPPEQRKIADLEAEWAEWVETPGMVTGTGKVSAVGPALAKGVSGMLNGVEVSARSVLPVRGNAAVRFRWGLRLPAEVRTAIGEGNASFALRKLPLLVMSKISIEHVAGGKRGEGEDKRDAVSKGMADVAEACMGVRRQLEVIQEENGMLRKAVEDLKGAGASVAAAPPAAAGGQLTGVTHREADVGKGAVAGRREGRALEGSGRGAGQRKEEMTDELKKALMGSTASGAN